MAGKARFRGGHSPKRACVLVVSSTTERSWRITGKSTNGDSPWLISILLADKMAMVQPSFEEDSIIASLWHSSRRRRR